jgi:hypothetical protein
MEQMTQVEAPVEQAAQGEVEHTTQVAVEVEGAGGVSGGGGIGGSGDGVDYDIEEDVGEDDNAEDVEEGIEEEGGQQPVTYRLIEF